MPPPARLFIRTPVFWAATGGVGLIYLVGALVFAHTGEALNFGWLSRFDFGPSLLLGVAILYGGAWLFWRRSGGQPPQRAGWRGAAYGVLTPLAIIVLVGGYNAADEALRLAPYYGATVAGFCEYFGSECFNYIVKPLAYIMPLGSLVAGPLGWWVGRRAARTAR
ncbi:hypothetical protein [Hymenobacter nivis]|uniref:Uncharacterized protein n=1 Tax=Hymenobacter nivis TaxID=1850093 RepID=A0A502GW87_9BACT|nr:hypothetical protein [Hymenobacter nivis]TPG66529.1 hypothetical protein EAH73_08990 [Hymenobacter nivis]